MAIFWVYKANMREVIDNAIKPLGLEKKMLTHFLGINTMKDKATSFLKFHHITQYITILIPNVICQNKKTKTIKSKGHVGKWSKFESFHFQGRKERKINRNIETWFDGADRRNQEKWQQGCGQNQKPWPDKGRMKSHPLQQEESYALMSNVFSISLPLLILYPPTLSLDHHHHQHLLCPF